MFRKSSVITRTFISLELIVKMNVNKDVDETSILHTFSFLGYYLNKFCNVPTCFTKLTSREIR